MWEDDFTRAQALVIGACMTEQTVPPLYRERIREDHFCGSKWGTMWKALVTLYQEKGEIVYPEAMKVLEDAGFTGLQFLEELHAAEEESFGYRKTEWPVRTILAEAQRRGVLGLIDVAGQKLEGGEAPVTVAAEMQRGISSICEDPGKIFDGGALANMLLDMQDSRERGDQAAEHLETGFASVDDEMRGLGLGKLTLISGPTGHGKTSIAVNWLHHITVVNHNPSLFVSLEMPAPDILDRFIARMTGHSHRTIWNGKLSAEKAVESAKRIADSGLSVTDNSPRNVTQILAVIERDALLRGTKVVVVDYVGEIVEDRKRKTDERNDQMYTRWIRDFRRCAVVHGLHMIVLCQNNKEGDLAESKAMSHVADTWYHFWRKDSGQGGHRLQVRKARSAPVGHKYLIHFNGETQTMREMGRDAE